MRAIAARLPAYIIDDTVSLRLNASVRVLSWRHCLYASRVTASGQHVSMRLDKAQMGCIASCDRIDYR